MNNPTRLDQFYRAPTLDALRQLTNNEFDSFLAHLFELAGYQVSGGAGALFLAANGHPAAVARISYGTVLNVGKITIEEWKQQIQGNAYPFDLYVTRTDFASDAQSAVAGDPSLVLLNGDQSLRFYQFMRDSRLQGQALPPMSLDLMTVVDAARQVYAQPPRVLVVANNRGGIGKSTTALNIAYGLSKLGKSVLAIDLDPQANFTEMLGGQRDALLNAHLGHYFAGNAQLPHLIQRSPFEGVLYLAAHPDMSKAVIDPGRWPHAQLRFAELLRDPTIAHHPQAKNAVVDWIVIDTPPEMGFHSQAALMSANYILVPTFPSTAGNNGVEILIESAHARKQLLQAPNHGKFIGFVATRYFDQKASAGMRQEYIALQNHIDKVLRTRGIPLPSKRMFVPVSIPDTPSIVSATRDLVKTTKQGHSFPVFEKEGMGKNDAGAAYKTLVEEVVKRAN
jgi:chromosome partitioning protein